MRNNIDSKLNEMRTLVTNARSMPMSASAVVNRSELLELIDSLDGAIDATIGHATVVVGKADKVVEASREEAEQVLRRAQVQRDTLVSDTEVYRLAQERADEIVEVARREAAELRAETDAYVEENLANFELTLDRTLEAVRRGRARLMEGVVHGLADDSDVANIDLPDHLLRDQ